MAKKFSLAVEKIDQTAIDFINAKPSYSLTIEESDCGKLKQIKISHNKETGVLNCFISAGQVSYSIQGNNHLKKICEDCWNTIVKETSLPCTDHKTLKATNVKESDFNCLMSIFSETEGIELTQLSPIKDPNVIKHYYLKGKYDAKASIIYFKNGTVFLQGAITSFFLEIMTEIMEVLSSVSSEVIEDFISLNPTTNIIIDPDISKHISCSDKINGSKIEDFIKTSISLANSGIQVEDYGCYTFGLLKALDALIIKRLSEDAPGFADYGTYFEQEKGGYYKFHPNVGIYDNKPLLKTALERAYNFYHAHRHTTFHIDKNNIETSRTLSYDDALGIINDGLKIMNNICSNW